MPSTQERTAWEAYRHISPLTQRIHPRQGQKKKVKEGVNSARMSSKPLPLRKANPTPENLALSSLPEMPPPLCLLAATETGKLDLLQPGLEGRAGLGCDQLCEFGPVTETS